MKRFRPSPPRRRSFSLPLCAISRSFYHLVALSIPPPNNTTRATEHRQTKEHSLYVHRSIRGFRPPPSPGRRFADRFVPFVCANLQLCGAHSALSARDFINLICIYLKRYYNLFLHFPFANVYASRCDIQHILPKDVDARDAKSSHASLSLRFCVVHLAAPDTTSLPPGRSCAFLR